MPSLFLFTIVWIVLQMWVLSLGGGLTMMLLASLPALGIAAIFDVVRNKKLDAKIAAAEQTKSLPITGHKLDDLIPPGDELYFEIDRVYLYEASLPCCHRSHRASPVGKSDPAHLRAGGIGFWDPDSFNRVDRGRLIATSKRLIFQGRAERREWQWTRVWDIRYDHAGLLIWRRNGRARGLGLSKPDPRLFAFVKAQIRV